MNGVFVFCEVEDLYGFRNIDFAISFPKPLFWLENSTCLK